MPAGEVTFIAIKHGARIIAASAIRDSGDKVSNLPLGVCVLNEYRCRGLGTYLLHESLRRLRDRGLKEARVVTRKGLPADRYLYPKFGGERVVWSAPRPSSNSAFHASDHAQRRSRGTGAYKPPIRFRRRGHRRRQRGLRRGPHRGGARRRAPW